jgi:hypothetical protein
MLYKIATEHGVVKKRETIETIILTLDRNSETKFGHLVFKRQPK